MDSDLIPKGGIVLIACDIDGTLIPFGSEKVSDENRRAIEEARDRGVLVTLATGRHYMTAKKRVEEMGVGDLPVIASNGADVRISGCSVHTSLMDDDLVERIVRDLASRGVPRYLFCGDDILCLEEDRDDEMFAIWTAEAGGKSPVRIQPDLDTLLAEAKGRTQKMLTFVATQEQHDELLPHMLQEYGDKADITCGGGLNLELNAVGVSKADGLRAVCDMLGVPIENVMAIGDSGNDAEMLREAGLGVAVGDAMDVAKEAADVTVAPGTQNGLAEAISRFVLSVPESPGDKEA